MFVLVGLHPQGHREDKQLEQNLEEGEVVLDPAPLDLDAKYLLGEGHRFLKEAYLREPDDVVREEVNEREDS